MIHKRPLVLRFGSGVEIYLEKQCAHCGGTDIDILTNKVPCTSCIQGYQLTEAGETLVILMRFYN